MPNVAEIRLARFLHPHYYGIELWSRRCPHIGMLATFAPRSTAKHIIGIHHLHQRETFLREHRAFQYATNFSSVTAFNKHLLGYPTLPFFPSSSRPGHRLIYLHSPNNVRRHPRLSITL